MLNTDIEIMPQDDRRVLLCWTAADAALDSWVFGNGRKLHGPLMPGTCDRDAMVTLAADECVALEVHDVLHEEVPAPLFETPNTRPVIQWNPLPAAARYRLYHREAGKSERCVFDRPARDFGGVPIRIDAPIELAGAGGVWHFLRVEAVDAYGNESTRRAWRYFAMAPPGMPSRLEIADGTSPGFFHITVTP